MVAALLGKVKGVLKHVIMLEEDIWDRLLLGVQPQMIVSVVDPKSPRCKHRLQHFHPLLLKIPAEISVV